MKNQAIGKWNISVGLWMIAGFMLYGFVLIYLRDFAPGKEAWIESYNTGAHFEARLAHVHGNLFSFLNIVFGFLLVKLPVRGKLAQWASWLALAGLLMPLGILGEVYLGLPFYLVLVGGLSIFTATILLGLGVIQTKIYPSADLE
ncbi:MAG: hypothetical protein DWQ07_18800 [Chloroflexi bacterium]|nr:MAG: hypothetical protein DWQ07_18800 [Chloroflexota bacterium]MBL1194982.1 hypothetical protein [Chloroflexota bacterium]NOH12270.1 hypothetical protein [Chloroflexota bacterium]